MAQPLDGTALLTYLRHSALHVVGVGEKPSAAFIGCFGIVQKFRVACWCLGKAHSPHNARLAWTN